MEREVAEKVAAMVAVMVVEVRVVARAAVMVEVVRVVVPAEVMVEAVMEVVPTKVNPRTTQKMMMSQVSTSSIYTDLFSAPQLTYGETFNPDFMIRSSRLSVIPALTYACPPHGF